MLLESIHFLYNICFLSLDPTNEPAQPARLATVYNVSKIPAPLKIAGFEVMVLKIK
jgi:hypothetical protein